MSNNPVNLGLRFVLELVILYALGYWGWTQHTGWLRYLLAIGLPLLAGVLWGTFRTPGDDSAGQKAIVPVPGWLRFLLEFCLFASAIWALFASGAKTAGWVFGILTVLHYAASYDRVLWLLGNRKRGER